MLTAIIVVVVLAATHAAAYVAGVNRNRAAARAELTALQTAASTEGQKLLALAKEKLHL